MNDDDNDAALNAQEECEARRRREPIGEIAAAFAAAQAQMRNPAFDRTNPHFRSKYATLAAVRDAVIPALAAHGIACFQDLHATDRGISCETLLVHSSGQSLRFGPLEVPASKIDAQGFGSAATYARRYALMAVCNVVGDDDDDANAATASAPPANVHNPRDGMDAPDQKTIKAAADRMQAALEMDADEDAIAVACFDVHDSLKREPEVYVAASDEIQKRIKGGKAAWKKLVERGRELAHSPAFNSAGRAA